MKFGLWSSVFLGLVLGLVQGAVCEDDEPQQLEQTPTALPIDTSVVVSESVPATTETTETALCPCIERRTTEELTTTMTVPVEKDEEPLQFVVAERSPSSITVVPHEPPCDGTHVPDEKLKSEIHERIKPTEPTPCENNRGTGKEVHESTTHRDNHDEQTELKTRSEMTVKTPIHEGNEGHDRAANMHEIKTPCGQTVIKHVKEEKATERRHDIHHKHAYEIKFVEKFIEPESIKREQEMKTHFETSRIKQNDMKYHQVDIRHDDDDDDDDELTTPCFKVRKPIKGKWKTKQTQGDIHGHHEYEKKRMNLFRNADDSLEIQEYERLSELSKEKAMEGNYFETNLSRSTEEKKPAEQKLWPFLKRKKNRRPLDSLDLLYLLIIKNDAILRRMFEDNLNGMDIDTFIKSRT